MKGPFYRGRYYKTSGRKKLPVILSVVALIEVLAILVVSTSAWIESISSIRIYTAEHAKGVVETAQFQQVNLENNHAYDIDLTKYFRPSGGYHLAPASSSDGNTMYFKANMSGETQTYRLGSVNDKNVNYVSFTVKTLSKVSLAFAQVPTIKFGTTDMSSNDNLKKLIRFSVGDSAGNFNVYSLYETTFTENVISGENGATASVTVRPFRDFVSGRDRVVETTQNGYLSFNLWIQDPTGAQSTVYQDKALTVSNLKLVTVVPFEVVAVSNNAVGGDGGKVAINDGAYGATATCYVSQGVTVALHAAPSATDGFEFSGWTKDLTSGQNLSASENYPYTVSNVSKLYAKFSDEHVLYMRPDYQHSENVRYAAYVFGSGGSNWFDMTKVTSGTWENYYKFSYKGSANSVIFCYMDPNASGNNFDNRWFQTFDLRVPAKNGEYGYIVTSRAVYNVNRNTSTSEFHTNKLFGYWKHCHAQVNVDYKSDSDSGTKGDISAALKDSTIAHDNVTWYPGDNMQRVDLDGEAYQDYDANGNVLANQKYEKIVTLTAADSAEMDFKGWYDSDGHPAQKADGTTAAATEKTIDVVAPANKIELDADQNPVYTQTNAVTYYAKYQFKPEVWYLKGSFNNWGEGNAFTKSSGNVYTASIALDDGNYTFKIYDKKRDKWYSNQGDYYADESNPAYPSNTEIPENANEGQNIKLWATKGTYTFTFDVSNHRLTITPTYETVRIWFNTSSFGSANDYGAKFRVYIQGFNGDADMIKSGNDWYIDVQSVYRQGIYFKRCNPNNMSQTWTEWNAGDRSANKYTYYANGLGTGNW